MTDEKWESTMEMIRKNYQIEEADRGDLPEYENATYERVVFDCPLGKFQMTRTKKPRVIDKKTQFSNRIGSDVKVDYVYSKDEFVDSLEVLKWNEITSDWQAAKLDL